MFEPTEEQVEAVAKAIAYQMRHPLDASEDAEDFWKFCAENDRRGYTQVARAAIAAMPAVDVGRAEVSVAEDVKWVDNRALCDDCPPDGYPTDKTRCKPCPRRALSQARKEDG